MKKDKSPIQSWAEHEVEIATSGVNQEDLFIKCYQNVLKAYNILMDEEYSGGGFYLASSILKRLLDELPLTPIQDEDFFYNGKKTCSLEIPKYLKERGLKSSLQCPRMSSLFREEDLEGNVTYKDIDRVIYHDIEKQDNTFGSYTKIVDELFPITMPYYPSSKKYHIYTQEFLSDKKNGDFDTRAYLYLITPDNEKIEINRYFTTPENGRGWIEITKEKYDELLKKRIDKLEEKIAQHLLTNFIYYTGTEEEISKKQEWEQNSSEDEYFKIKKEIEELCKDFNKEENWKFNTSAMYTVLTGENESHKLQKEIENNQFLKNIQNYFKELKNNFNF